jgi:NitT/TauT family transport system substrate-binding protein
MFRWSGLILLLTALCGIGGCSKAGAGGPPPPLAEVRLAYFANVTHAQAVLGVYSGDFQNALGPIKLKTKVFNAGPELMQALNAGEVDIAYVGPGPVISAQANSNGTAVCVLSGAAANGVAIVARRDSGITSLKDLAGKRIATPQLGNTQDVSARHFITAVLGQSNANNVLPIPNSQQAGMMLRGKIDAAWVPEPWASRLISDAGAVLIGEEKDLWPGGRFALTVVVTTPRFLAAHPDVLQKMLAVHHQWTTRLQENPHAYSDQLNAALAALTGMKLPASVLQSAIDRTQFTDDPLEQTFMIMGQWSADLKFIPAAPALTGLFQTDIIHSLSGGAAPPAQ